MILFAAILRPTNEVNSSHFHCSLMLTRPKDNNKRGVILNLCHPLGHSINDEVDRLRFDNRYFTLILPVIVDILEDICVKQDPVLFKIDIAHTFKFGMKWQGKYFLDGGIAFRWVHVMSVLQVVMDPIAHIMKKRSCVPMARAFDGYIGPYLVLLAAPLNFLTLLWTRIYSKKFVLML